MTEAKRLAGEKAIEYVEDGMIVGVGTGSTVAYLHRRAGADQAPHRGRGVQLGAEHAAPARRTASRCSTSTAPARCRCTSTAPTNATRTSA